MDKRASMKLKSIFGITTIALPLIALSAQIASARPARLIAQDADAEINVRQEPGLNSRILHYGLPGDRVEVLRSIPGRDSVSEGWHYLRFSRSGAQGWVRADFLQLEAMPTPGWSKTYQCGEYRVTLRQYGSFYSFEYQGGWNQGLLAYVAEGDRSNTGKAWEYRFYLPGYYGASNIYTLTDAWGTKVGDTGSATFQVESYASRDARSPQWQLRRSCSK